MTVTGFRAHLCCREKSSAEFEKMWVNSIPNEVYDTSIFLCKSMSREHSKNLKLKWSPAYQGRNDRDDRIKSAYLLMIPKFCYENLKFLQDFFLEHRALSQQYTPFHAAFWSQKGTKKDWERLGKIYLSKQAASYHSFLHFIMFLPQVRNKFIYRCIGFISM